MNARKIFKDCVILNAEEAEEFVKRIPQTSGGHIFYNAGRMLSADVECSGFANGFYAEPQMIEKRRVRQKDICALCSAEDCPFNNVSHKNPRVIKVKLLGNLYNQ